MILSKIDLIGGPISLDTPEVVIKEVSNSCGFSYPGVSSQDVMVAIMKHKGVEVHEDLLSSEYSSVSSWINCNDSFKKSSLLKAFSHIKSFMKNPFFPGGETGPKTNATPLSFDACMLYRLCRDNGLTTTRNSTIVDMGFLVSSLSLRRENILKNIMGLISGASRGSLINAWSALLQTGPRFLSSGPALTLEWSRVVPTTSEEAIAVMASRAGVNISSSCNPLDEYQPYLPYYPVDTLFRERFEKRKETFMLALWDQSDIRSCYSPEQYSLLMQGLCPDDKTRDPVMIMGEEVSFRLSTREWKDFAKRDVIEHWEKGVFTVPGTGEHITEDVVDRFNREEGTNFIHSIPSIRVKQYVNDLKLNYPQGFIEMFLRAVGDHAYSMRGWKGEMYPLPFDDVVVSTPTDSLMILLETVDVRLRNLPIMKLYATKVDDSMVNLNDILSSPSSREISTNILITVHHMRSELKIKQEFDDIFCI